MENCQTQDKREEFLRILQENVQREGVNELVAYLTGKKSQFFTSPASTRYHGAYEGGLCEHSVNVYHALKRFWSSQAKEYNLPQVSEESLAIVALLHDICKDSCYKLGTRNVKDENGTWQKVPTYTFDDPLPYGHGEKSVYVLSGFIKLTREEAFAIRYHMGFSNEDNKSNVGKVFEMYPLAFALSVADMMATYWVEGSAK